jgi:hypothetical protein
LASWKDIVGMSKMLERRFDAAVTKHIDRLDAPAGTQADTESAGSRHNNIHTEHITV